MTPFLVLPRGVLLGKACVEVSSRLCGVPQQGEALYRQTWGKLGHAPPGEGGQRWEP